MAFCQQTLSYAGVLLAAYVLLPATCHCGGLQAYLTKVSRRAVECSDHHFLEVPEHDLEYSLQPLPWPLAASHAQGWSEVWQGHAGGRVPC